MKKIKNVTLNQCETKTSSVRVDGADLYHNVTYYVPNLLATEQGVTANPGTTEIDNRLGNEVVARGIKIRAQWICDPKRPNMNIKLIVFKHESNETPNDANFWSVPVRMLLCTFDDFFANFFILHITYVDSM